MIEVKLVPHKVEQENGPVLLFEGPCNDYLGLISEIHVLASRNDRSITLNDLHNLKCPDDYSVRFSSKANSRIIAEVKDYKIITELDSILWKDIMHKILSISFSPSYNFIEFEEGKFVEDLSIIMKSYQ